jgi:hypothetical protein
VHAATKFSYRRRTQPLTRTLPAYGDAKVANRDIRAWHGATEKWSLNDGRIQNPSNPFGIVPLSNFVPRGFGFVHHSIAILYHEVPNPNLTIRNFFIAVPQAMDRVHRIGQTRPVHVYRLATAHSVEGRMLARANEKLKLEKVCLPCRV